MKTTVIGVAVEQGGESSPAADPAGQVEALLARVRMRGLTYLTDKRAISLYESVMDVERKGIEGVMIEAGCGLGGSSILIASAKAAARAFAIYDLFARIPAPSPRDGADAHRRYEEIQQGRSNGINGAKYYGYVENLCAVVRSNLRDFGIDEDRNHVRLVPGMIEDTLNGNDPVVFAHIDVDWHDTVLTCLERIGPRLAVGGVMIIDDYHDWSGCKAAADRFLAQGRGVFHGDCSSGAMRVTRIPM